MSQKRFLDYGTTADASKTKVMHHQMFSAQVLRVDEPFFSALAPDQLLINHHAVIFDNGIMLTEDEVQTKIIATSYGSASYTIYYEHEDEDIIGGVAATLQVVPGLLTTVINGVILGWVVYPGGSVPLDNTMLYANWRGPVVNGQPFEESVIWVSSTAAVPISNSTSLSFNSSSAVWETVPISQQIDYSPRFISRNLADINQKIRVFSGTTNVDFVRVSGVPGANEFNLDGNGLVTFNVANVGESVAIADITYGANARIWINGSATDAGYADTVMTFPVKNIPIRTVFFEYVVVDDYTVDPVEIFDAEGNAASFTISKSEHLDGQISRLTVRLIGGIFQGVHGEAFTVRLRATTQPSGMGADLRCRASVYDLPI